MGGHPPPPPPPTPFRSNSLTYHFFIFVAGWTDAAAYSCWGRTSCCASTFHQDQAAAAEHGPRSLSGFSHQVGTLYSSCWGGTSCCSSHRLNICVFQERGIPARARAGTARPVPRHQGGGRSRIPAQRPLHRLSRQAGHSVIQREGTRLYFGSISGYPFPDNVCSTFSLTGVL